MLTYINILQRCLPNYHKIHYPIDKIQIYKKTIYKINTNYWKNIYQNEIDQPNHKSIKILYYIFIYTISKQINTKVLITNPETLIKEKYKAYKNLIQNIFLAQQTKQEIQNIFERTQRYYFILKNFLRKVQCKRNPIIYKITTDLSLQPLDPNNNTFIIYDTQATTSTTATPPAYLFSVHDLIRIIQTAITNTSNFFEKPLSPRNPYTNIEFTEHTLYAIFYKLYKIHYPIPPILIKYYRAQFDQKIFLINNQMEIRDISIKNFVTNSPTNILYDEIMDMINENFYNPKMEINIDKDFPKTTLIQIMRPYLYLFLLKEYYIYGSDKRELANKIFKRAVNNFMIHNSRFGSRKEHDSNPLFKFQPHSDESNQHPKQNSSKKTLIFFDDHPKFSMHDIETYLKDPKKLISLQAPEPPFLYR